MAVVEPADRRQPPGALPSLVISASRLVSPRCTSPARSIRMLSVDAPLGTVVTVAPGTCSEMCSANAPPIRR